jgi:hypothetical protein
MIITFDFDETLTKSSLHTSYSLWVSDNSPNHKLVAKYREHMKNGDELHIVTFRAPDDIHEVKSFMITHELEYMSIVATDGQPKLPYIVNQLNSVMHYDDDANTCVSLKNTTCKPVLVVTDSANNNLIDLIDEKI